MHRTTPDHHLGRSPCVGRCLLCFSIYPSNQPSHPKWCLAPGTWKLRQSHRHQISKALVDNSTVTSFKCNNCGLNDEDCSTIMQALIFRHAHRVNKFCLTCRPRTKRISFARNNIGAAGAEPVCASPRREKWFRSVSILQKQNYLCLWQRGASFPKIPWGFHTGGAAIKQHWRWWGHCYCRCDCSIWCQ